MGSVFGVVKYLKWGFYKVQKLKEGENYDSLVEPRVFGKHTIPWKRAMELCSYEGVHISNNCEKIYCFRYPSDAKEFCTFMNRLELAETLQYYKGPLFEQVKWTEKKLMIINAHCKHEKPMGYSPIKLNYLQGF